MGKRKKKILTAAAAVLIAALGCLAGVGIRKFAGQEDEYVAVYSVESLRDKEWSFSVTTEAVVEEGKLLSYYCDSKNPISEVYVLEGQLITEGTELFRLDTTELEQKLNSAKLNLENQDIYRNALERYIDTLKQTEPVMDGLGSIGSGLLYVDYAGAAERRAVPLTAEQSLEGQKTPEDQVVPQTEQESGQEIPVIYEVVGKDSMPYSGSGTQEEPYRYYVKKGGQVRAEGLAMLVCLEKCTEFFIVEDAEHLETPIFVWKFDGKVYEEQIRSDMESSESESSEAIPSESQTEETKPSSESGLPAPPETESSAEESTEVPDFDGEFDEDDLQEALGELDSAPHGYTKEELNAMINERLLEYENLELAIRKKEKQIENLETEIEACVIKAESGGQILEVLELETAVRTGQPVFRLQETVGYRISGYCSEALALSLTPGDRLSVSVESQGKEAAIEAVFQSVNREPSEDIAAGAGENPRMSYYLFTASLESGAGIQAGDTVKVLLPREKENIGQIGDIVLPDKLIFYEHGKACVYVMGESGTIEKRVVETGRSILGTETEILSGITVSEYLAYPEKAAGYEGTKAEIIYGEEMEIGKEKEE